MCSYTTTQAQNMIRKLFTLIIIFLCSSCQDDNIDLTENNVLFIKDSIRIHIKRQNFQRAYTLTNFIKNDSLKNSYLLEIAYETYKSNDTVVFKKSNEQALRLSRELKDTLHIAEAHWNLGSSYSKREKLDSSYYHYFQAQKYYELINHRNYSAKMLFNMAFIQSRLYDYVGAESKLFQSITISSALGKNLSLYRANSLLGSIYKESEDYDNSILYHNKALNSLEKVKDKSSYRERSLSDLGITFHEMGDFNKAITNFEKALTNDSLYGKDPLLYAKLIDNLGYSKLKNKDTIGVKYAFLKALEIRDSLMDYAGIVINKIHLSEYFLSQNDTTIALAYIKDSYKLATETKNNRDILASLMLLSEIDLKNSGDYLNDYVALSDNIDKQERLNKNKFARIRFETDEYIRKAERLSFQKTLLVTFIVSLSFIFLLAYFLKNQRAKTKQLYLENQQRHANEEIYKLMLQQQNKLEEGRLKERYRISEELHDGVLGKIYGARMGIGFLNLIGDKDDLKKHQEYLEDLQIIEGQIRDISHELKNEILSSNTDYLAMIQVLVFDKSLIGNFKYDIIAEETLYWNDSNEGIKVNVYRIIQEALQNIIKHSKATHVTFKFEYNNQVYILVIEDNGVGFNTSIRKSGIGLENIKSRVNGLNGSLTINSNSKSGTIIEIKIPSN